MLWHNQEPVSESRSTDAMTIASFAICQVVHPLRYLQIKNYLGIAGWTLELLSHLALWTVADGRCFSGTSSSSAHLTTTQLQYLQHLSISLLKHTQWQGTSSSVCAIQSDIQFLGDSIAPSVAQQPDSSLSLSWADANRTLSTASSTARTASHTTSACSRRATSMVSVNGTRYISSQCLDRPVMGESTDAQP